MMNVMTRTGTRNFHNPLESEEGGRVEPFLTLTCFVLVGFRFSAMTRDAAKNSIDLRHEI